MFMKSIATNNRESFFIIFAFLFEFLKTSSLLKKNLSITVKLYFFY